MGTIIFGISLLVLAATVALTARIQSTAHKLALLVLLVCGALALRSAQKEPAALAAAHVEARDDVCRTMSRRFVTIIGRHEEIRHEEKRHDSKPEYLAYLAHAIRVDSAALGELLQTMNTVCLRPASSCDALIERLSSEEHPLSEDELRVLMRAFERQQGCDPPSPPRASSLRARSRN